MKLPSHDYYRKLLEDFCKSEDLQKVDFNEKEINDSAQERVCLSLDGSINVPVREAVPETSAMDQLMALTGLQDVKLAISSEVSYHRIMSLREKFGKKSPKRLMHMLLTGNPGCGKTTVSRLIGKIYKEEGILSSGHFVEANRASLVGRYIGESEQITSEKIEEAKGGILFIDEIYSLTEGSEAGTKNDFGNKVIDTLLPVLSDESFDIMVIGAGYRSNMQLFIKSNPGLASRFPVVIDFKDFTLQELMEICHRHIEKYEFNITAEADNKLASLIDRVSAVKNSGNARVALTILNNYVLPNLCMRIDKMLNTNTMNIEEMSLIISEDIPGIDKILPLIGKSASSIGFSCKDV